MCAGMHDRRSSNELGKNKSQNASTGDKNVRETKKNTIKIIINKLTNPEKICRYVHNFMAAALANIRCLHNLPHLLKEKRVG